MLFLLLCLEEASDASGHFSLESGELLIDGEASKTGTEDEAGTDEEDAPRVIMRSPVCTRGSGF